MIFVPSEDWWQACLVFAVAMVTAELLIRFCRPARAEIATEANTRMTALDGLRGLLCIGVFVHHAALTLQRVTIGPGVWDLPVSHVYNLLGRTSVNLFFCVTGFLFWGRVIRGTDQTLLDWFTFARGRVLRIAPMYLFSAIVVLAVTIPHLSQLHASAAQLTRSIAEIAALGALPWKPVFTDDGVFFPAEVNAGVHWTLRYEWAFYAIIPAFAFWRTRGRMAYIWVAIAAAWVAALVLRIETVAVMFPIGMIAAHVVRNFALCVWLRGPLCSIGILLSLLALAGLGRRESASPFNWTTSPISLPSTLFTGFIFAAIASGNDLFGFLRLRSLRLIGVASYSIYLLHGIALYAARPILDRLGRPDTAHPNLAYWLAVAGLCVVVTLVSMATSLLIERPFILWERRLRAPAARERSVEHPSLQPVHHG